MKSFFSIFILSFFFIFLTQANPPASKPINKPVVKVINKPVVKPKLTITSKPIIKSPYFPKDTLDKFIKAYGKDSLLKLIDERIFLSSNILINNFDKIRDMTIIPELKLMANHFNLSIDSNLINTSKHKDDLYSLYGKINGDTTMQSEFFESIEDLDINIIDSLLLNSINDKYALISFIIFSNRIVKNNLEIDKVAKAIYEENKTLKINDKIQAYYLLNELYKMYTKSKIEKTIYNSKLFDELYPDNNLRKYYLDLYKDIIYDTSKKEPTKSENEPNYRDLNTLSSKIYPLRFLAYALYNNDINLQTHSVDLFYLLDAQQKNGSWSLIKKFNYFDSNADNTNYGLWSLCQFREMLIKK